MAAVVEEKDVSGVEEKATPSVAPTAAEETAEEAGKHGDEEDTGAQIAPIVKLEEVVISTGEENEDVLLDMWANRNPCWLFLQALSLKVMKVLWYIMETPFGSAIELCGLRFWSWMPLCLQQGKAVQIW